MCGIVGALAIGKLPKEQEAIRQKVIRFLTTELMILTEDRGKDATGAVLLFNNGKYYGLKRGDRSTKFLSKFGVNDENYGSLLQLWKKTRSPVKAFVGHCRATTVGVTTNNMNNHPIKVGNIVGIHNGTLKNDDEIIKNLECGRDADVDSEAIFRLAAYYTNNGEEPFTMEIIEEIVHRLDGSFSVIMFNGDNPDQVPVFRDSRPMEFVFVKELATVFIISEQKFWNTAHCIYERAVNYYDNGLPTLIGMDIEKGSLDNDGAAIFDLTTKITKDTKLEDLAEWQKLPGTGRIWKSPIVTTYPGYNTTRWNANDRNKTTHTPATPTKASDKTGTTETAEDVGVKRHMWNDITKKYIVKVGDTKLEADKSKDLMVTTKKETPEKAVILKATVTKVEKPPETKPTEKKITDLTEYRENIAIEGDVVIDVDEEEEVKSDEIKEIIVDMEQEPAALVQAAEIYFEEIPKETRGFENDDQLMNFTDIKDAATMSKLGFTLVGNRVFKSAWKKGFIVGCKYASALLDSKSNESSKTKKREKHIVGLKALIIVLAQFFNKTMGDNENIAVRNGLAAITMNQKKAIPMGDLEPLFHGWEEKELKSVKEVVTRAVAVGYSESEDNNEN